MQQKNYELQCLYYACLKTIEKGGEFASPFHISNAIKKLVLYGYDNGFTNNGEARSYISQLDSDKVERELILNLIKQRACENKLEMEKTLLINKKIDDKSLTTKEVGILLYDIIKNNTIEVLKWNLNKYPFLYSSLAELFVETRYFDTKYTIDKLEDVSNYTDIDKQLLDKVNSYYDKIEC